MVVGRALFWGSLSLLFFSGAIALLDPSFSLDSQSEGEVGVLMEGPFFFAVLFLCLLLFVRDVIGLRMKAFRLRWRPVERVTFKPVPTSCTSVCWATMLVFINSRRCSGDRCPTWSRFLP